MKKNYNIALSKIIACFAVVALHTQRNYQLSIVHNPILYYFSRFAIPLFMIVNGYLILSKRRDNKYYWKKIFKIIIFLLIWSTIFSILKKSNPLSLFIDSIFAKGILSVFWFFWSLIFIYLFNVLFIQYTKSQKKVKDVFLIFFIISILIDAIQIYFFVNKQIWIKSFVPQSCRLWTWIMYFYLGGIMKINESKWKNIPIKKFGIILLITSFFAVLTQYYVFYGITKSINSEYVYDNILIILWASLIFIFISKIKIHSELVKKIIFFIEDKTIGIYVIHIILLKVLNLTYHTNGFVYSTLIWIGIIICCIGISTILSINKYSKKLISI